MQVPYFVIVVYKSLPKFGSWVVAHFGAVWCHTLWCHCGFMPCLVVQTMVVASLWLMPCGSKHDCGICVMPCNSNHGYGNRVMPCMHCSSNHGCRFHVMPCGSNHTWEFGVMPCGSWFSIWCHAPWVIVFKLLTWLVGCVLAIWYHSWFVLSKAHFSDIDSFKARGCEFNAMPHGLWIVGCFQLIKWSFLVGCGSLIMGSTLFLVCRGMWLPKMNLLTSSVWKFVVFGSIPCLMGRDY